MIFLRLAHSIVFATQLFAVASTLLGQEAVLKGDEVVVCIGGEAMAKEMEGGYLEVELLRIASRRLICFRGLAWEGDTVFEQRRDLNFPSLEMQLDSIGASVVVAQFGEMESLAGEARVGEFTAAYEKLVDWIDSGGKRRVVLCGPFAAPALSEAEWKRHETERLVYTQAIQGLAQRRGLLFISTIDGRPSFTRFDGDRSKSREGQLIAGARSWARQLGGKVGLERNAELDEKWQALRLVVVAKNRLWFNYWRPQNWAFLNGDRTAQPSSRDHLDPSKRWFPAEMEQFLPLIKARENEIDALAAKLAQP